MCACSYTTIRQIDPSGWVCVCEQTDEHTAAVAPHHENVGVDRSFDLVLQSASFHSSLCRYVRTIIGKPYDLLNPPTNDCEPVEVDGTGSAARTCYSLGVAVNPAGNTLYWTE
jgi:hypothetical protein